MRKGEGEGGRGRGEGEGEGEGERASVCDPGNTDHIVGVLVFKTLTLHA